MVNLVNAADHTQFRHAIVCVTECTNFKDRIKVPAPVIAINKQPGKDLLAYIRFVRCLRTLAPAVVHTRNVGTMDCLPWARLARVPGTVHGEHGREMTDVEGDNRREITRRRMIRRFVDEYICVSDDLAAWLSGSVGVPRTKIHTIRNGVDTTRFSPSHSFQGGATRAATKSPLLIGTVGRLTEIKGHQYLIRAVAALLRDNPRLEGRVRLIIVGEGHMRSQCESLISQLRLQDSCRLYGETADVPTVLREWDVFALPSLGEGLSNTILEAMATGLPVVATRVGGNPEAVLDNQTGILVAPASEEQLAEALRRYLESPELRDAHGRAGRERVCERFSLAGMVRGYEEVYSRLLNARNFTSWLNR